MAIQADGNGLILALTRTEPSQAADGALNCALSLRNRGSRPLWVNRRMAVNHPLSPPHLREVDFLIQDNSGRVAEFAAKVRVGLPRSGDFLELAPGEAVERSFDLAFWYMLEAGEEYEVQAIYESYFVPEDLKNAHVWTGRLASRTLKMMLEAEAPALAG